METRTMTKAQFIDLMTALDRNTETYAKNSWLLKNERFQMAPEDKRYQIQVNAFELEIVNGSDED